MRWLRKIPLSFFIVIALMLAFAPFTSEPHLWQKLKMLWMAELVKPLDIFDLLLHGTPISLLLLRLLMKKPAQELAK